MSDIGTDIEDLAQKRARLAHWCYMKPSDAAARIEALEAALRKIADLIDSEAGEPLDDAIAIANAALDKDADK